MYVCLCIIFVRKSEYSDTKRLCVLWHLAPPCGTHSKCTSAWSTMPAWHTRLWKKDSDITMIRKMISDINGRECTQTFSPWMTQKASMSNLQVTTYFKRYWQSECDAYGIYIYKIKLSNIYIDTVQMLQNSGIDNLLKTWINR